MYVNDELELHTADLSLNCFPADESKSWGHCADRFRVSANHIYQWKRYVAYGSKSYEKSTDYKILTSLKKFRTHLYRDWSRFWDLNRIYLVASDIAVLIRSLLLQELFGADKTGFVFVIKVSGKCCIIVVCYGKVFRLSNCVNNLMRPIMLCLY